MTRPEHVIDHVLSDAAAALIRSRSRPNWLPPGFPMQLILTKKREPLVDRVVEDHALRKHLRARCRRYIDSDAVAGVSPTTFEACMRGSSDPHRYVAAALIDADAALSAAASQWALHPETIPSLPPLAVAVTEPVVEASEVMAVEATESDEAATEGCGDAVEADLAPETVPAQQQDAAPIGRVEADLRAQLDVVTAERDQVRAEVARLEALTADLRSRIPTRGDKKRQNRQQADLRRVNREVESQAEELAALRTERDDLLHVRHELEDQLEEAQDARTVAIRKSQQLERQLAAPEGRANYLRRSLEKELVVERAKLEELRFGPDRTAAMKRAKVLGALLDALDAAFPVVCETEQQLRRVSVGRSLDVTVTPIGGGIEIGGSAILVEAGGRRILVDAGLHPEGRGPALIEDVFNGGRLDAIVITHAHNDHAGFVPAMVARYPRVPVYCSSATAHLLPTMWNDSANVMARGFEEEAGRSTGVKPPLYGKPEVEAAEDRIEERSFGRPFNVGDLHLTLFPAGHILGAAGVVIEAGDKRVVITGDISGIADHYLSVDGAHLPEGLVTGADLLVIETTYCGEERFIPRARQEEALVDTVQSVLARRGRVLIPAFGLGRAQEVVLILTRNLPELDILVDGLAKDVSIVYETFGEASGRPLPIFSSRVRAVENRVRERQSFHSGVIVASSGMLTGGASVFWANDILGDARAALLLCGYQDEDAPGRQLERLINSGGRRTLRLPDQELGFVDVEVRAQVEKYALSAHADRSALVDIIERIRPKATMLVHGLPDKQAAFAHHLRARGIPTVPTAGWSSCPA
jgi:Cft2 family RNA processing exonuclease